MFTKDLLYCNSTSPTYLDANKTESVFEIKAVYVFLVLTLIFMSGFVCLFVCFFFETSVRNVAS